MTTRVRNRSRKRDAILEKLRSTETHPTAEWIYLQLKPQFPELSLGTVYRNLSQFREEGTILSVGTVCGQERFDGDTSSHSHFICKVCQSVVDMELPIAYDRALSQLEETGCKIDQSSFTATGVCKACLEN